MPKAGFQRRETSAGVSWVYQYTDPLTRRRRTFVGATVAECSEKRAAVLDARRALRNGASVASVRARLPERTDPSLLTLEQAWAEYIATKGTRARATAAQYWRTTINLAGLGDRLLPELDRRTMAAWAGLLFRTGGRSGRGRAYATVRLAVDYVAAAIRHVGAEPAWGDWRPNPKQSPVPPRDPTWAGSVQALRGLLERSHRLDEKRWTHGGYACRTWAIAFAALTGLRNSELAGLGWDDVQLDDGPTRMVVRYHAPKGWPLETPGRPRVLRKNGKVLRQRLHPQAEACLRAQRDQLLARGLYRPDGPVWPTASGTWRLAGRVIDPKAMRRFAREAGLQRSEDWNAHALRHTYCSLELVATGGDLAATARRSGHTTLKALEVYAHELGDGTGSSRVPEFELPGGPPCPTLLAPPSYSVELERAGQTRSELKRVRVAEARRPFSELAAEWLEHPERGRNGQRLPRPRAVTDAARRNAAAAYQRAKYAGESADAARAAWKRAKTATLAAWSRALKTAAKNR